MKKAAVSILMALVLMLALSPARASEQVTYLSQPEQATIFLNNVAFVHDALTLGGNAAVQIILPDQIFQDTLILRENGERVPDYSISRASGKVTLQVPPSSAATRNLTLDYLASGLSWKPDYDMQFSEGSSNVDLAFFAEIDNSAFTLDNVEVTLAAGRVDTTQQVDQNAAITANQYIAGYDTSGTGGQLVPGAVTIQHQYTLGKVTAAPGDTLYTKVLAKTFPARRVLLWNAQTDQRVSVIYKVKNDSDMALAEGIVRSYQDNLFVGSDFIEFTPEGSEGSVTVGSLPDVRVNRSESLSAVQRVFGNADTQHQVTLTMSNFGSTDVQIEVVDTWNAEAVDFAFSQEPQRDAGNLFRWTVTIPAGQTVTITYEFKAPS
jgi:hypothetical protein